MKKREEDFKDNGRVKCRRWQRRKIGRPGREKRRWLRRGYGSLKIIRDFNLGDGRRRGRR